MAMKSVKTGVNRGGRPAEYDREEVLEAAMLLFWQKGFEGTSMTDLTRAMGLSTSSIYKAFGDKQALFAEAVERYVETRARYSLDALKGTTFEKVLRDLFHNTIAFLSAEEHPPRCMLIGGAMGCSAEAAPARDLLIEARRTVDVAMRERFAQAQRMGELPSGENVDEYTQYVSTVLAGLSVKAASGATSNELRRSAKRALRSLGA